MATKLSFKQFIKQIQDADTQQVACQFKIANVLTAIRDHKLYKDAGYNNFAMMVQAELDFAPSTAHRYISLYESYVTFKYSESEFLRLMQQFGWSRMQKLLFKADKKMGYRAMKTANQAYESDQRGRQFHFELSDKTSAKFESMLSHFGMTTTKGGSKMNVTSSLEALVADYDRLRKAEFKSGSRSKRAS